MDIKLLLTQAITLLYLESKLKNKELDSKQLVLNIIKDLKPTEGILDTDSDKEIIGNLRSTIFYICEQEEIDPTILKQRLRFNTKGDTELYDIIIENFEIENDEDTIRKRILHHTNALAKYQKEKQFKEIIKKYVSEVLYSSAEQGINVTNVALRMQNEIERFALDGNNNGPRGITGVVNAVNFNNREELLDIFRKADEETSVDGVLKTGWQSLNRMLGWHTGFRRGDFLVVGALQHNFKTGFTLKLLQQMLMYNKPWMLDAEKKPLMLHISSENALTDNVKSLYEYFYTTITGKNVDPNVDENERIRFVQEQASKNGYTLEMLRVDPTNFTYSNFFQMILEYESLGYEIHACFVDYLQMFSKEGCTQGPTGSDTRDLFRRVRNFTSRKKIFFCTPHQISTEAKYLLRQGVDSFVKEIVNKGYYDSCKTIDQEVDIEILIHKVEVDGVAYLEMQRGKHRKSGEVTPFKDLYAVLPFNQGGWGGIMDDINKADSSMRKPGGLPNGQSHLGINGSDWMGYDTSWAA